MLSPQAEAIKLVKLWRLVRGPVFPIDAASLAKEWSCQAVPDAPIADVVAQNLDGFEGGLFWLEQRKVWALLYRQHEDLPGRTNFTIAHEFGHFVLHRKIQDAFQCAQNATLGMTHKNIEREADQFASYLLMPIDDFREQIGRQHVTLDLLGKCADRYGVSLTAAILKWVDFTEEAAIVVVGREGMLNWWRGSTSAKKHGLAHLQEGMELPSQSLAAAPTLASSLSEFRTGIWHAKGVWITDVVVREMVNLSDRYDMSISLLILDIPGVIHDDAPDEDMTTTPPTF